LPENRTSAHGANPSGPDKRAAPVPTASRDPRHYPCSNRLSEYPAASLGAFRKDHIPTQMHTMTRPDTSPWNRDENDRLYSLLAVHATMCHRGDLYGKSVKHSHAPPVPPALYSFHTLPNTP
jgi:hypothetical protein